MDQKLFVEMERIKAALSKHGKHSQDKDVYLPTLEQIEAAKLRIRKARGEVAGSLE